MSRPTPMPAAEKARAANERRRRPSRAEHLLWEQVRERKLGGFRFVREKEILGWWADFYCAAGRLVVEVDGKEHRDRRDEDNRRDEVMRAERYRVLRLPAALVFNDLPEAVRRIELALNNAWARARRDRFLARAVASAASASDPETPLDDAPPELKPPAKKPLLRRFHCGRCQREFSQDVSGGRWIECYRCLAHDQLIPVCYGCGRPVPKVVSIESWRCRRCQEIRSVASRAAGAGETPVGPLHERRGKARRLRPNE